MGTSTWQGRGRADAKRAKAAAIAPGAWAGALTVRESAVSGAITARWSVISWSRPRPAPRSPAALTLASTSTGEESDHACPTAVATLVTPGPVMTRHTPGRPLTRA